jgi:hypothetical protein
MLDRQDRSNVRFGSDRLVRFDEQSIQSGVSPRSWKHYQRGFPSLPPQILRVGNCGRPASGGVNRSDAGVKYRDKKRRYFFFEQHLIETTLDQ